MKMRKGIAADIRTEKLLCSQCGKKEKKKTQWHYSQHYMSVKCDVKKKAQSFPSHFSKEYLKSAVDCCEFQKCILSATGGSVFLLETTHLQSAVYTRAAMNICINAHIIGKEAVKLR